MDDTPITDADAADAIEIDADALDEEDAEEDADVDEQPDRAHHVHPPTVGHDRQPVATQRAVHPLTFDQLEP